MGITMTDTPHPPLPDGGFWQEDETDETKRYLRPNWDLSWADNQAAWGDEICEWVQQDGPKFWDKLKQEEIDATPRNVVLTGIRTYFNTAKTKYHKSDDKAEEEKVRKRKQRRKLTVSFSCNFAWISYSPSSKRLGSVQRLRTSFLAQTTRK